MNMNENPFLDQREFLVDGVIRIWAGETFPVFSPMIDDKRKRIQIGSYPAMDEKTALEILNSSCNAYDNGKGNWPTQKVENRIACVLDFVEEMKTQRGNVVDMMMWEIGKNLKDCEKEFDRTVQYIYDTVEALKDLDRTSSRLSIKDDIIAQIRRAPLGVVLCMGPFNYPLNESMTTLIPALIMGNVIIFKPPKFGVLLFSYLLEAFQKHFPYGVVNTIYGDGPKVIGPLMTSGKIDVLAFIGTSKVADILRKQHPKPHRLRCVLGLEAKNAAIVTHVTPKIIDECVTGALTFNGQRCTALKIFFVHTDVYEQFVEAFTKRVDALTIGMPWENADITPLPEDNKIDWLNGLVLDATSKGAQFINNDEYREELLHNNIFFPVILKDVTPDMRIFSEEQFGPIVPIVRINFLDTAIQAITNSNYGQQVSIFTECPEIKPIAQLIDTLTNQVCRVNINCQCQRGPDIFPFTGRKDSAEGTLSVSDTLRVFSIRTMVATKGTAENKEIFKKIIDGRTSNFLNTDYIL